MDEVMKSLIDSYLNINFDVKCVGSTITILGDGKRSLEEFKEYVKSVFDLDISDEVEYWYKLKLPPYFKTINTFMDEFTVRLVLGSEGWKFALKGANNFFLDYNLNRATTEFTEDTLATLYVGCNPSVHKAHIIFTIEKIMEDRKIRFFEDRNNQNEYGFYQ